MRILVRAVTGFAVLGAGCTDAGLRRQAETPGFIELRNSIGDVAELDPTTWPSSQRAWAALGDRAAVLVLHDGWRVPDGVLEAETKAGLRQFLARGGRLVLLGYAARLVHELGVEPRPPDVCAPYRWGYDDRTTLGKCQLGFKLVSGRQEDLVVGLTHAAQREHVYLFTGGTGVCVPTCLWEGYDPERGEVLGRLSRLRDNQPEDLGAVALAQWRVGAGSILACGLLPDLQAEDPQLRQNAAAFTTALARWLVSDREKKQVRVWRLPEPPVPPPPEPLLPLGQRELPAAPLLAHWGVEVPLARSDKSPPPSLDAVVHDVLLPSWLAGADLLRLDLADPAQGWPLSWPGTDPLRPPEEYRGSAFWPQWGRDACGLLCVEAHARGVLVQGGLEPLPVPSAGTAERLAGLRFVARELADTRLLGERAFDGFVLRPVNADPGGYTAAMLQDFTPGGALVQLGALVPAMPGSTGAVDADDGRMRGLSSAGLSAAFRGDGFPGDLFPFGRLDCTAVQALASSSEQPVAGGSSGDWIVTQANDFVRTRMGRGASMWWRAHDPATLATDTLDYVRGISLEPLRAAVAMRLSATGKDGWRDAQRGALPAVQDGFGAESPLAAGACVLQNNWLRLCGTGGLLLYDAQGLARFRPGEAVLLARELFRTRLFGGRPDAGEVSEQRRDFIAGSHRGPGGYQREQRVGGADPLLHMPAALAFAGAPEWPQRAVMEVQLGHGLYELTLELRPLRGAGVVTLSLDGERMHCWPFHDGRPALLQVVNIHLARPGVRTLELECADGGAVAVDMFHLERVGDLAAEGTIGQPAGYRASIDEWSASTYHQEHGEVVMLADQPGFLWRAECQRACRNLRTERLFQLGRHRTLGSCSGDDNALSLRAPFVLLAEGGVPPLAIVPLQLSRYEHFELRKGEMVLCSQPEAQTAVKVGFLLLQDGDLAVLPHLPALFRELDRPTALDLGERGEAALKSDLPLAWTRVLELHQPARTPFLVRENGWWLWRGGQPLQNGGELLRVCQLPGDTVAIVGGGAVLERTRPGPGSLHTVALRDPTPDAVTVRVLEASPLGPPSVTMAADFDEVEVDGRPWSYFQGRTVLLPQKRDTVQVKTHRHGGQLPPHLVSTRAAITACAWNPASRELAFIARASDGRPSSLPYTAFIAGPEPKGIDGAERVPEAQLRHADATLDAAAKAAGIMIRFRPGLVRIRYVQ